MATNEVEAATTAEQDKGVRHMVDQGRAVVAVGDLPQAAIDRITDAVIERMDQGAAAEPPQFREVANKLKAWGGDGAPPNLLMRLNAVMAEIGTIPKSLKHKQHSYMFSSVDDVTAKVRPLFAKHGIYQTMSVVSREYQSFPTQGGGVGYNGNFVFLFTLYNSTDPSDSVGWEGAGLITNPGEKLDWVALSQFLKFFLLNSLMLDRGEDADSSPGEGPSNTGDAMQQRRRQTTPPRRDDTPPPNPPANGESAKNKGWGPAWEKVVEGAVPPKNDGERVTRSSVDNILNEGSKLGWADDMVRLEVRRKLGVNLEDISWTIADRLAWIFGHFPADKYFVPPGTEEASSLISPVAAEAAEPAAASTKKK